MQKQIEKQSHIRWNHTTQPDSNFLKWFFLIINDKREIDLYTNRIYRYFSEFQSIDEGREWDGKVPDTDLSYRLLTFETQIREINWSPICKRSKIIKDERLYDRQRRDGLLDYIDSQLAKD